MQRQPTTDEIAAIAHHFGLRLMVQFGSSLDPERIEHPESDIDLAVLAVADLSLKQLINLQVAFAESFGVFEDRIDLVNLATAGSLIRHQIVTKGQSLFDADGQEFNRCYVQAVKQYIDEEDLRTLRHELLAARLEAASPTTASTSVRFSER